MRLQNKVIIITGSTTGIGKAIALRCVAEGARVVIHGLEESWGRSVVDELGQDKAVLHIEDISQEGAPHRLVDLAIQSFGKLDAIVNNAAMVVSSNIHTTDKSFIQRVLEVNTIAPFELIKAALSLFNGPAWLCIKYRIGKCMERRTQSFCLQYFKRCFNDDDQEPW